jgi:hypothetical protein
MRPAGGGRSFAGMPTTSHKLVAAALATAAATGVFTLEGGHGAPAAATDAPRTLTFTEPFVGGHNHHLDLGRKGIGPGDVFLSTDVPIFDPRTGHQVGTTDGMETIVSARHHGTVMLYGAARLRDGRIDVAGLMRHSDATQTGVIVGGTGAYLNSRGQVTVTEDTKHKRNVVTLTLTR